MKFEVGDKVRILDGRSSDATLALWTPGITKAIGTIGTVRAIDEWDNTFLVSICDNMASYWMQGNWLAPVEKEKKPEDKIPKVCIDLFYTPKHIYKGDGKTVVMWEDGTKTIVKRAEGEPDNDYAAFTAALAIKIYGDNSKVNRIVRMTETVEKRKKKKKQKEAAEGEFEVIRWSVGENKSEYTVSTHHSRVDAEGLAAFLNAEKIPNAKYYVREKGEE